MGGHRRDRTTHIATGDPLVGLKEWLGFYGPDGMRSFPPVGKSVIRGTEIRIEGTTRSPKTEHQRPVEKPGWG